MTVVVTCKFLRHTQRAVLVDLSVDDGTGMESFSQAVNTWLPLSQIENARDVNFEGLARGCELTLNLSDWIARQKNITGASAEADLERFTVEGTPISDVHERFPFRVMDGGTWMCYCPTSRTAQMIAAALNMTQGKV